MASAEMLLSDMVTLYSKFSPTSFHNHRTSDLVWRIVLTTEQATNPRTVRGYEMSRSWLVCMGVHLRLWTCMCACICSQVLNCFPLGPVSCTLRCLLPPPSFTPVAPVALTRAPPSGPFPHPFFTPKSLPFAVPPPEAFLWVSPSFPPSLILFLPSPSSSSSFPAIWMVFLFPQETYNKYVVVFVCLMLAAVMSRYFNSLGVAKYDILIVIVSQFIIWTISIYIEKTSPNLLFV